MFLWFVARVSPFGSSFAPIMMMSHFDGNAQVDSMVGYLDARYVSAMKPSDDAHYAPDLTY